MFLHQVFDEKLAQYAYIIGCQKTFRIDLCNLMTQFTQNISE